MTPLHKAAQHYAAQGIPVFPCEPGSKKPRIGGHGFHDATTSQAQIDAWWAEKDYNVAFCPHASGLAVVDLDGPEAENAWLDLQIEHGQVPDTYTVQTPRGFRHLYFTGVLSASQSILGPHIDTRGVGSYALLPPSQVRDGVYQVTDPRSPSELPAWIPNLLANRRQVAKATVHDLDLPGNIARGRKLLEDYVSRGIVAVEGQMGDLKTFETACELLNLGVSPDTALELMEEIWNPSCVPPWESDDLAIKVENARRYAQNEAGAWGAPPAGEVFSHVLDKLAQDDPRPAARSRFYPYDEGEQDHMPEPTWLIPDLLPAQSTVMLYGQPESYKSFIALDIALSLAGGLSFEGTALDVQPVVFVAGEGPRSISRQRRPAWKLARKVDRDIPFHLIQSMPLADPRSGHWLEFIQAIHDRKLKPGLVVIDTLSRAMAGMNENDAKDASLFVEAIEQVKREFGCTVLVVHHAGKADGAGARGSSALEGGFDAVFEAKADKAVKAVAVTCRKMKDSDHPLPRHYELRMVGSSLVPFPIDSHAYKLLTSAEDRAAPKAVGAALVKLGAYGEGSAVTSRVLACEMLPPSPDESAEQREESVSRFVRALSARARAQLEAYTVGTGRDLRWSLPGPRA